MLTVQTFRLDIGMADRPLFTTWDLPDDARLQEVLVRTVTQSRLPYADGGIIWQLTGGGITQTGTPTDPSLSGPGSIDFAQVLILPIEGRREVENKFVEVVPGCLMTPIRDLPVLGDDGIARFWWWEPHQPRW